MNSYDYGTALKALAETLSPVYLVPRAPGCHDIPHVTRMVAMADEICDLIGGVDKTVFKITVWLHNIDRIQEHQDAIKAAGLGPFVRNLLPEDFPTETADMIVDAVLQHSKKDDAPEDSKLLLALRVADKWDRIGVLGGISGFEWLGCKNPAYQPEQPFGYGSTAEGKYKTLYQGLFRVLEWYGMSPQVRTLAERHPWKMAHLLFFIRAFGREVAEAHNIPDSTEKDIEKALGKYYPQWGPSYTMQILASR